jgi:hypothetical protein
MTLRTTRRQFVAASSLAAATLAVGITPSRAMGGNFDPMLRIDENGRVSPRGPMRITEDETMLKLYASVVQINDDGTGASCMAFQDADGFKEEGVWTTKPDAVHYGQFVSGVAMGTGMAIAKRRRDGKVTVFTWREMIQLA